MSLSKSLAGRKQESDIWDYFEYHKDADKSKCIVVLKSDKICGAMLAKKNPTNLKTHLRCFHPEQFKLFAAADSARKCAKEQQKADGDVSHKKEIPLPLNQFISMKQEAASSWAQDSLQYKTKLDSVLDMLIMTGMPVTTVDNESFHDMIKALDSKFN
jgi:hypothetical protein